MDAETLLRLPTLPAERPIPHWELSQDRGIGCQSLTFFLLNFAEGMDHIAFYSTIGVRYALSATSSTTPTMTARTAPHSLNSVVLPRPAGAEMRVNARWNLAPPHPPQVPSVSIPPQHLLNPTV